MGWQRVTKKKVKKLLSRDLPEKALGELLKNQVLLVNSSRPAQVASASKELYKVFNQVKKQGIQPLFIGAGVCDTMNFKKPRLNLSFATKASEYSVKKVYINQKAEQLFLYGRDIWAKSISRVKGRVTRTSILFVYNNDGLFLGLAFALTKNLKEPGSKTVLENVIDKGHYLRVES